MRVEEDTVVIGLPNRSSRLSTSTLFLLLLLLFACLAGIEALRMTALKIPPHVVLNQTVRMECDFDLDQEILYSVKWYKDGHEFYRYVPKEQPDVHVFTLDGVTVDKRSSSERSVVLRRVNADSTGRYRCEVSAEAPAFHTVSEHADMTVVVLPDDGPIITGGKLKYNVGDIVRMNCTSAPSKPPASLVWYINEEPVVDSRHLKGPRIISADKNGLERSQLGLEFHVHPKHFNLGNIKLKCLATISTVYKRSNERHVAGDERYVNPMESRETRAQSHTRGEPNGTEARATRTATILSTLSIFAVSFFTR